MLLIVLAYLGGVLTILSPCILPVLPFVFSRAGQPFVRSVLPMLTGMALTFAAVASLATVGGSWITQANQYGRWLALALLAVFGLMLLLPRLAAKLMQPLISVGNQIAESAAPGGKPASPRSSFLIGIATGLLWSPCAGPILGLMLTTAALRGTSFSTTLLLVAYAAGAATSLALALLIGGRVFTLMKRWLGAGEWIRRGMGAAMLLGVLAISLGWDTGVLARVSTFATGGVEQELVDRLSPARNSTGVVSPDSRFGNSMTKVVANIMAGAPDYNAAVESAPLPVEGILPTLSGAVQWLNSPPLTVQALRGKVVVINIWTYSCINCLRSLPYLKTWSQKYKDQGLVVIGVHAPEFAFERNIGNVKKATRELGVDYPVAIDNNFAIWRGLNNEYWPAQYFVDARGQIRHHNFGEGNYAKSEQVIQLLLTEAGDANAAMTAPGLANTATPGVEIAADSADLQSPETYIGYAQADNFASPGGELRDEVSVYVAPTRPALNEWGLAGKWDVEKDRATLAAASGHVVYRFHARDLHLVLGPGADGKPVRFRVSIDGAAPGNAHGTDVAADGSGTVTEHRLYQLVRQTHGVADHTFSIEFLDPGVEAYAFTFG